MMERYLCRFLPNRGWALLELNVCPSFTAVDVNKGNSRSINR